MVSAKHHIEQGNCLIAVLLRVSNKFNTFSFLLYVCLSVSHSVSLSLCKSVLSVFLLSLSLANLKADNTVSFRNSISLEVT